MHRNLTYKLVDQAVNRSPSLVNRQPILGILGAGESGVGAALLGKKLGMQVWVSDAGQIKEKYKTRLEEEEIPFESGGHTEEKFFEAEIIVKSPGIPEKAPLIQILREKGKYLISEVEFAAQHCTGKIIAITGSNGKTTTTSLVYHLLKDAGLHVEVGGNIGRSFAELVATTQADWYVLEVSSFQLDDIDRFCPDIAVLTNITPDHLDRYNYELVNYAKAKFRIAENQGSHHPFLLNLGDPFTQQFLPAFQAKQIGFSQEKMLNSQAYLQGEKLIVDEFGDFDFEQMQLLGKHNQINTLAALLCVRETGVSSESLQASLNTFRPIPHRLEPVGKVKGAHFINDSKATNVDAVYYALESMKHPTIWMAGGVDKGNEYAVLKTLVKEKVKHIIVLGAGKEKFAENFTNIPQSWAGSMEDAMEIAEKHAEAEDRVLLSPACASFDLFKNYEDRGDQFRRWVENRE